MSSSRLHTQFTANYKSLTNATIVKGVECLFFFCMIFVLPPEQTSPLWEILTHATNRSNSSRHPVVIVFPISTSQFFLATHGTNFSKTLDIVLDIQHYHFTLVVCLFNFSPSLSGVQIPRSHMNSLTISRLSPLQHSARCVDVQQRYLTKEHGHCTSEQHMSSYKIA